MSFWAQGFWSQGFWSAGFWQEEEEQKPVKGGDDVGGLAPWHVFYGHHEPRKDNAPEPRLTPEILFPRKEKHHPWKEKPGKVEPPKPSREAEIAKAIFKAAEKGAKAITSERIENIAALAEEIGRMKSIKRNRSVADEMNEEEAMLLFMMLDEL